MNSRYFQLTLGMLVIPPIVTTTLLSLPPLDDKHALAQSPVDSQAPSGAPNASPVPVEEDMHEFMEYVFQPNYNRLKSSMAKDEKDGAVWKEIKSSSLTLAEGGNLLLLRGPDEARADWTRHAASVRELGAKLYRAAKGKNSDQAQQLYETMLHNCNSCHEQFAGGEPQLKP